MAWVKRKLGEIDFKRSDEAECLLFVVDFSFPCHLHEYLDWAPPCKMTVAPELLSEYSRKVMLDAWQGFLGRHCSQRADRARLAFVVHSVDKTVLQKSLVQVGWRVLEFSRLQMLMNHFTDAVLTLTHTDSAHYFIKADRDPLLELALANEDEPGRWPRQGPGGQPGAIETALSHLTASQLSVARRAGELGGFSVEHLPRRVWEEINLRAKLYSTRLNDDADEQKSKGIVKRRFSARSLPRDDGDWASNCSASKNSATSTASTASQIWAPTAGKNPEQLKIATGQSTRDTAVCAQARLSAFSVASCSRRLLRSSDEAAAFVCFWGWRTEPEALKS